MTLASRLLLILGSAAVIPSCGGAGGLLPEEGENFNVILRNSATDGQFIHIFGPDETNDILNRLQPGQSRTYRVDNAETSLGKVTFTAGRNFGLANELRVTKTCEYIGDRVPTNGEVVWNGTSLSCGGTGWFAPRIRPSPVP